MSWQIAEGPLKRMLFAELPINWQFGLKRTDPRIPLPKPKQLILSVWALISAPRLNSIFGIILIFGGVWQQEHGFRVLTLT